MTAIPLEPPCFPRLVQHIKIFRFSALLFVLRAESMLSFAPPYFFYSLFSPSLVSSRCHRLFPSRDRCFPFAFPPLLFEPHSALTGSAMTWFSLSVGSTVAFFRFSALFYQFLFLIFRMHVLFQVPPLVSPSSAAHYRIPELPDPI